MPPQLYSRHRFSLGTYDADENLFLSDRNPYRFRELSDTRQHVVTDGDTIFGLSAKYYSDMPRPAGLWWIIADFQPEPIHDPTLKLTVGRVVYIPSLRAVQELIFSDSRYNEAQL